jgi:CheY-like chemotaxis protein
MPVASGWEVLEWIKSHRPDVARSCVIVLTAAVRELKGLDAADVYAVLTKPFELEELRSTVKECIENRKR